MTMVEFEIPEELWSKLEACARCLGRSTEEIILEAIRQFVEAHSHADPTERNEE
jgi:predicted transcriptional regulator